MSSNAAPRLDSTTTHPPIKPPDVDTAALAELADLLADTAVRAWALAPTPVSNQPIQLGSGKAGQLVRRAGLGTEAAQWAVVAQPRPELVALDIDECAELMLSEIRQVATDTATEIVATVASGRPDCVHLWCAPASRSGRHEFLRRVELLREHHQLPSGAVDDRSGKPIRLPGSSSLKPAASSAQLIDPDSGELVDVHDVIRTVRAAVPGHTSATPRLRRKKPEPRTRAFTPPLLLGDAVVPQMVTEAPRAWRKRTAFTPEEWIVLNDSTRSDRSAAATDAAWILWRHGIRSASAALWWYQRCAAFVKFRHRDENSREPAQWSACRQHWGAITQRARNHQPEIPASDQQVIDAAREEIRWWADADLQAAAAATIDRFADGYGLTDRPLARRDLQLQLHLTDGTATARISTLVSRGLLVRSTPWGASAPREAARYSLAVPASTYRGESAHDVTIPSVPLGHALWGTLHHSCRRALLTLLQHPASPTSTLAHALGLPPGDASHGTRLLLHRLESVGLAFRSGRGRGTTWSAAPSLDFDAAARRVGALTRAAELAARICGERAGWHAESRAESTRALRGLALLRRRLTHADVRGRRPAAAQLQSLTHPPRKVTAHTRHAARTQDLTALQANQGTPRTSRRGPSSRRC